MWVDFLFLYLFYLFFCINQCLLSVGDDVVELCSAIVAIMWSHLAQCFSVYQFFYCFWQMFLCQVLMKHRFFFFFLLVMQVLLTLNIDRKHSKHKHYFCIFFTFHKIATYHILFSYVKMPFGFSHMLLNITEPPGS